MRTCGNCGLSIGDSATFCSVCGAHADATVPTAAPSPSPAPTALCAVCGHSAPLSSVGAFRLCVSCHDTLELLTDRETGSGVTVTRITTEAERRRSDAQTVLARYSAILDGLACPTCEAMDDKTTTDLEAAAAWTPNPSCTSKDECRCMTMYELTSLTPKDVAPFLKYAVSNGLPVNAQSVDSFYAESREADEALSTRMYEALEPMHEAYPLEKTDAARAIALYRESVVRLLEVSETPMEHADVRRELLFIYDRLSLVLKRSGMPAEALEEVEAAASLGLLDCQDAGVKGHREALTKRLASLRRTVAK